MIRQGTTSLLQQEHGNNSFFAEAGSGPARGAGAASFRLRECRRRGEALLQIGKDVVDVLRADGETDGVFNITKKSGGPNGSPG